MNRYIFALLVIITTSLMGSSFAVGKMGLEYVSPLFLAALRFTLAGMIMVVVVKLLKRPHPKTKDVWLKAVVIGFFQTAGVISCIFLSLQTITSGESAILTFMNPLLVVVFGTLVLKMNYKFLQWVGVSLGFVGVFITLGGQVEFKIGTLFGFLSAVSWAIATLLVKSWGNKFDTWVLSAYQMLFGGLFIMIASFLFEQQSFEINLSSIGILIWLAIMASIVQFALWYFLLQKGDPGKTSSFLFLAPFFGVISGWVLLGEELKWYVMAGGLLIFIGIFLVNWRSHSMRQREKRVEAVPKS
ncbi:DMT family transporter [Bacillus horti]|uniref:Drug/metabolite transporter (DMT)-like permease n=1 Tax=Caldalkalibacillus horti TaxID=77523 RepID=A0ABT9VY18_9BACI|nr:DMT family transporter [Bacillus horti]MDQ0165873.1 drug/metabolite transporter (DMT)-like permease [Bacillus horti]